MVIWLEHFFKNPFIILMTIVLIGYLVGNIQLKGISLGSSAVLLVGLVFGHFGLIVDESLKNWGLICFVTAVGYSAGPVFFKVFQKKAFSYIMLSMAVVLTGLVVTFVIIIFMKIPSDLALGIFNGALTSTPGLAAATEIVGEGALVGYGIAYPFGVVCVVLFIQMVPRFLRVDLQEQAKYKKQTIMLSERYILVHPWMPCIQHNLEEYESVFKNLVVVIRKGKQFPPQKGWCLKIGDQLVVQGDENELRKSMSSLYGKFWKIDDLGIFSFFVILVLGIALAKFEIPLPNGYSFALGSSGGPLILGLLAGYFGHCSKLSLQVPKSTLAVLQEMGLLFFLAGAGSEAGQSVMVILQQYGFSLLGWGAIITVIPVLVGYIMCRYVFHFDLLDTLGAICGSMTSTPSLGTLIQTSRSDIVAAIYAATYPMALVMMILSAQITALLFG